MFRKNIDFSQGKVWKIIVAQAIPLTVAQLVQVAYNLVDRIYIGHIEGYGSLALTGVGVTFPIITLIMAFTALFGIGGVPLFSISKGEGRDDRAAHILGNSCTMLLISAAVITAAGYIFLRPLLYLFGASGESIIFAEEYMRIYLGGTVFSMLATGLNGYINAQGFPVIGMNTILFGAGINIILDPIFIFGLDLGVSGAAIATVISQAISALWVMTFLTGKKITIRLRAENMVPDIRVIFSIVKLGVVNFIMQGTTCAVQIACNSTLQSFGGDVYVGVMTVVNSVREILMLPVNGIFSGAQPVISYNYGAKKYRRVLDGITFDTIVGAVYTLAAWALVLIFPHLWVGMFTPDEALIDTGVRMIRLYFFGFVFMAFQFAGQTTFQALGDAKHAIIFSLLRKVVIVVPLTLLLPHLFGLGASGVFIAEPVSNVIGGIACYTTMRLTVYRNLKKEDAKMQSVNSDLR